MTLNAALVPLTGIVILAVTAAIGPNAVIGAGIVLPALVVCWTRPAIALAALAVAVFSVDWLTEELGVLPHEASWIIELLIGALVLRAFARRHTRGVRGAGIEWLLAVLLGLAVASAFGHGVPESRVVLGLRAHLRFIALFYALINLDLGRETWLQMQRLLLVLMIAQIPLALFQYGVLGETDDKVFGSLRSTGVLSVLTAIVMTLLVSRFLEQRSRWPLLVAVAFLPVPVLGEAKAFFLLGPLALGLLILPAFRRYPVRAAVGLATTTVAVAISIVVYGSYGTNADLADLVRSGGSGLVIEEQERLLNRADRDDLIATTSRAELAVSVSLGGRLAAIARAREDVEQSPLTMLTGFGLGSRTFTFEEVATGTSALLYSAPLATRIYETGYGGLLIYWLVVFVVVARTWRLRHSPDVEWRLAARALMPVAVLYLVSEAYTDTGSDPLGFAVWALAAMLVSATNAVSGTRAESPVPGGVYRPLVTPSPAVPTSPAQPRRLVS